MRPYSVTYTPAALSATGLASAVATVFAVVNTYALTATSAADSLAHIITFAGKAATDYSGRTVTVTGTNENGAAKTEVIAAGPNGAASVSTTGYFLTVTSVSMSGATSGADTFDIGWTGVSVAPWYVLDYASTANADIAIGVTGTINYTVQQTFANVLAGVAAAWTSIAALASKTALTADQAAAGATAFRVLVNSLTTTATFTIYTVQPVRR